MPTLPFHKGATGQRCLYHNSIIVNFTVYQNWIQTNLLQLFAHPENSEWFSVIPVIIIFEVNIVAERKQAYWQHFFVFSKFFSSALNFFTAYRSSGIPGFKLAWPSDYLFALNYLLCYLTIVYFWHLDLHKFNSQRNPFSAAVPILLLVIANLVLKWASFHQDRNKTMHVSRCSLVYLECRIGFKP